MLCRPSIIDIFIFLPVIPILVLILPLHFLQRYTPITYPLHSTAYNLSNFLNIPDAQPLVAGILLELILGYFLQQKNYTLFNTIRASTTPTLTAYYQLLNTCAEKFGNLDCSATKGVWEYSRDKGDICKMYAECMMTPMDPIKIAAWWKEFLVLSETTGFYWRVGLTGVVVVLWVWCILGVVRLLWACWRGGKIGRKGNSIAYSRRTNGQKQFSLGHGHGGDDEYEDDRVEEAQRLERTPTRATSRARSSSSRRRNGGSAGLVPRYYPLSYGRNENGERYRL